VLRVGGLRAGYVRAGEDTLELHGVVYVPGVRVRGRIMFRDEPHGVLRITGHAAARGRLVFRRDGSVTGRLGGRRVRVTAAASGSRSTQLARGGIRRVLAQVRRWPPDVPTRRPGSRPLPIAADQE
jgi:hypothetical protein